MKLVKMSLAAAVLLGASAFAIDNVKVSGDASLYYITNDNGVNADLFSNKANTAGDAALRLGVTADLAKGVSAGATLYAMSTLGLENVLVGNVFESGTQASTLGDSHWLGEAWLAATLGKTTVKIGRMELDTPLAFSEKWSIVPNTFEAGVLINQDLPNTTLVGAYVGKSNGSATSAMVGTPVGNVTAVGQDFTSFYNGAYAAAVVNNSLKFLTAQAWYYSVINVANAYWLQADWDCQLVKGVKVGAQYGAIDVLNSAADSSAYAFKLGYEGVPNLKLSAAYSNTDKKGTALKMANIATDNGTAQSKLYTETYWTYGRVGQADTTSYNVTAEYDAGFAQLGAYYTNADKAGGTTGDLKEYGIQASKAFGPLNATLAYVNTEADNASAVNTVLAMLKVNF
jgi:imipenem/basic amino acid-specific outer membrane pore